MRAKFTYTGIRVRNLKRSVRFYTRLFGMKNLGHWKIDASGGEVVTLKSAEGESLLELNYYPRGSPFYAKYSVGEGLDHLAFGFSDLDAAIARARRIGHPVIKEMKGKTGRWAYIKDPDGIWIEIFQG
jgi:lactoylglutathione lyase